MSTEPMFRNYYRHCDQEWHDDWSCACNDRCPVCNAEIEPYESEDLGEPADAGIQKPKFKVGDRVIWTNDYGVCWGLRTITEVLEPDKWSDRYKIEPTDTPWMYVREKNLTPSPEANPEFGTW